MTPSVYQSADAPILPSWRGLEVTSGTTSTKPANVEEARYSPEYVREQVGEWRSGASLCDGQAAMLDVEINGQRPAAPLRVWVTYRGSYCEIEQQDFGIFG